MEQIEVEIGELKSLMLKALEIRGISGEDAAFLIDDLLEAEAAGKKSHGLAKFFRLDRDIANRRAAPQVVKRCGCYAKVDGGRELGVSAARLCIDLGVELAAEHGCGIVALANASRYVRLRPFGEMIAQKGYIGIVMNNGGGAPAVAPFGGSEAIFGTNPICFAFPSNGEPYIFDFATSKRTWGEIRLADLENRPLEADTFLDKDGKFTVEPAEAEVILPFGGAKGYALCYAIEILTGALVGAKMGKEAKDQYDLGFLFLVLSPEMFGDRESFLRDVDTLAEEVRHSRPLVPGQPVRVPGERSGAEAKRALAGGKIVLDENIYGKLKEMSERTGHVFY